MIGLEQFLTVFGEAKIASVVAGAFIIIFIIKLYKEIRKYFIKKYEAETEKDKKINIALEQVNKYPQYRQQSIDMQQHFQNEINDLKKSQIELKDQQAQTTQMLQSLQKELSSRDKNKLQDRLLQYYRYYTDIEKNPTQTWTEMESQAFWALFSDYESVNGDGFMHSVVQPAMEGLKIIYNK